MRKILGLVAVGILAIFILVLAVKGLLLLIYVVFSLGKLILAMLFTTQETPHGGGVVLGL